MAARANKQSQVEKRLLALMKTGIIRHKESWGTRPGDSWSAVTSFPEIKPYQWAHFGQFLLRTTGHWRARARVEYRVDGGICILDQIIETTDPCTVHDLTELLHTLKTDLKLEAVLDGELIDAGWVIMSTGPLKIV
ncbi:hypothetical protein VPH49_21810 [Pseudomonas luteola]|uniref:hypothetical protein n=1 Tax=Pseudomonas luteola TaxID=47886 RepID=UPI003A85D73E